MPDGSRVLRYLAFGMMTVFAIVGGAFIVAESMTDPGGSAAWVLTASWLVPMVALSLLALYRPGAWTVGLTVVAAMVAGFVVIDAVFRLVPRDEVGPVGTIAVFAVAVALGCLGLRRPRPAGLLLLLVGATSVTGGASGTAVAIPVLVVGALYVLAAQWPPKQADTKTVARNHADSGAEQSGQRR